MGTESKPVSDAHALNLIESALIGVAAESSVALATAEAVLNDRELTFEQAADGLCVLRREMIEAATAAAVDADAGEAAPPADPLDGAISQEGPRFLRRGDSGPHIGAMQTRFVELGHPVQVTNTYDRETQDTVSAYQRKYGLPATGHVDPTTLEFIRTPPMMTHGEAQHELRGARAAQPAAPGAFGPHVEELQGHLSALGHQVTDEPGQYGTSTEAGVRKLQSEHGFAPTGRADEQTIALLGRLRSDGEREAEQAKAQRAQKSKAKQGGGAVSGKVQEASYDGNPAIPGSPSSMASFDYGGAVPLLERIKMMVLPEPPNLREADPAAFAACASCIFYTGGSSGCEKYQGYPVDRDDICDSWETLTPKEAQHDQGDYSGEADEIDEALELAALEGFEAGSMDFDGAYWLDEADLSAAGRKKMAGKKQALPDGSFPIPNVTYLKKAIRAFGRAGDKARAKAWIIRRARALGATGLLPAGWNVGTQEALVEALERSTVEAESYGDNEYVEPKKRKRKKMPPEEMDEGLLGKFTEALHPRGHGGKWKQKLGSLGQGQTMHINRPDPDGLGRGPHVVSIRRTSHGYNVRQAHPSRRNIGPADSFHKTSEEVEKHLDPSGDAGFREHNPETGEGLHKEPRSREDRGMDAAAKRAAKREAKHGPYNGPGYHGKPSWSERRAAKRRWVGESELDLGEVKSSAYPGLDRSPKENWVDKAGGLPSYIERIAKHLHYEKGKEIGTAIAIAVNTVKRWCAGGGVTKTGPHKSGVSAKTKAQACAAVAQWEAKKAASHATEAEAEAILQEVGLELDDLDGFAESFALYEAAVKPIPASLNWCQKILGEVEALYDDWDSWVDGRPPVVETMVVFIDEALEDDREWVAKPQLPPTSVTRTLFVAGVPVREYDSVSEALAQEAAAVAFDARLRRMNKKQVTERAAKQLHGLKGGLHKGGRKGAAKADKEVAALVSKRFAGKFARPRTFASDVGSANPDSQAGALQESRSAGLAAKFEERLHPRGRHGTWIKKLGGDSKLAHELVTRGHKMGDTEFSVKKQRFVKSGGYWPSFSELSTPKGMDFVQNRDAYRKAHEATGNKSPGDSIQVKARSLQVGDVHPDSGAVTSKEFKHPGGKRLSEKLRPSNVHVKYDSGDEDVFHPEAMVPITPKGKAAGGNASPPMGGPGDADVPAWVDEMEGRSKGNKAPATDASSALTVDQAIGGVLANFPGLKDWGLDKDGEDYFVTVTLDSGKEHKFHIDSAGEVTDITDGKEPPGSPLPDQPQPAAAPSSGGYHLTGDTEKPFHMDDGQVYKGADGKWYQKVTNTKMMGKKGPLAAVEIKNLTDGTTKTAPAFALKHYPLAHSGEGPAPSKAAAPSGDALFSDLMKSVGGDAPKTGPDSPSFGSLSNLHVVVTGKIPGYTRDDVHAMLKAKGNIVHSSVGKGVDVLIAGDNVGATKIKAAEKNGTKVVPWHEVAHLLEADLTPRLRRLLEAYALELDEPDVARARAGVLEGRLTRDERSVLLATFPTRAAEAAVRA
jgi:peptidoglycan hydrolase-like protein with peptidoglycan-binding domain